MPSPARIPESRPISDPRTRLPAIENAAEDTGEPIALTSNNALTPLAMGCHDYDQAIERDLHIRKLREAETEAGYRGASYSAAESKERIADIAKALAAHA